MTSVLGLIHDYTEFGESQYEFVICDRYIVMQIYLPSYICKSEHGISELMKSHLKKHLKKMCCIGNLFLTKSGVSIHDTVQRVLSMPMRHSNNVVYIPPNPKNRI